MALWDKINRDVIEVVEWRDPSGSTWAHRFNRSHRLIRYGATLVVRPSQIAVLVSGKQTADLFREGIHTLTREHLPEISTLQGWKEGHNQPIDTEVFFLNTRSSSEMRWFFSSAHAEGAMERLNGLGHFTFRIMNPMVFLNEVAGTEGRITQEFVLRQVQKIVSLNFAKACKEIPGVYCSKDGGCEKTEALVREKLIPDLEWKFGFTLPSFSLEDLTDPSEESNDTRQYSSPVVPYRSNANGTQTMAADSFARYREAEQDPLQIYLAVNGRQTGPFDESELREMIHSGVLKHDHLVWKHGMSSWEKAASLPEVRTLFRG